MFRPVNDMLEAHEDYGNSYYLGTVVKNDDPLGMMRIQVNVPGLYDTALGEVPWVGAKKDSPFGFGDGYGVYGCPQIGSTVIVELQGGDEHKALYMTFPTAKSKNPNFGSPTLWGFQDPAGNMVIYNMQAKTYTFVTASGARIDIDGGANRTTSVNNDTDNVQGNWTVNVSGNATIKSGGNIDFEASGSATYKASAHHFIGPIDGNATISAAGDITDLTGSGNTRTVGNMRTVYDGHDHPYTDDGNPMTTGKPNQQI